MDEINVKEIEKQRIEKEKARKEQLRKDKEKRDKRKRRIELGQDTSSDESEQEKPNSNIKTSKSDETKDGLPETSNITEANENIKSVKKLKVDIWKKVTVGDVFEAALERYLIRKQSRTTWP